MSNQPTIYYLAYEDILDQDFLDNDIYPNLINSYYWSDQFNCEFYIHLAYCGFISVSFQTHNDLVLLPEIQTQYAILDFEDLHISKKVKKFLKQNNYELLIDNEINSVIDQIHLAYSDNWIVGKYKQLLNDLLEYEHDNFQLCSAKLLDKQTKQMVAGEIGYIIGSTYTSLSGFSSKEKKYKNLGTLQLVLLAQYLGENHFSFWNLGHPHMAYKLALGAKIYDRDSFLTRWFSARNLIIN